MVEQMMQHDRTLTEGAIGEDDLRDPSPVGPPVLSQHALAEPRDQRFPDRVVRGEQVVDDLVARDRGGAVMAARFERLALPRSDAARDGDGDGPQGG